MNPTDSIPQDERLLAQLACARLAAMIKGLLSVGTGLCWGGSADAKSFVSDHSENLKAFAAVLHCISVHPSAGELRDQLSKQADRTRNLLDQFEGTFLILADSRHLSLREVREAANHLAETYGELCQTLQAYGDLVGLESRLDSGKEFGTMMTSAIVSAHQERSNSLASTAT